MPQKDGNNGLWWRYPAAVILGAVSGHFFRLHQLANDDLAGMTDKSTISAAAVGVLGGIILSVICVQQKAYRLVACGIWGVAFGAAIYLWK
jgi:hypothetical protein